MMGGTSAAETDEAAMAKVNEAKVAKSSREATVVDAGKVVAGTASVLPQTGDQPGDCGREREIHTITSGEPLRPHRKGVLDAEVSSTTEMAVLVAPEGPKVEGSLAIIPVGADP
jgi:hypothetical protein